MRSSALEFLLSLERFGMKFGLANIAGLCEALDHPEGTFRSILVAGTNGKGSVTAMVDAALRVAGHRMGRYTSPHLVRLEERFVIDGREVDPFKLEASAGRVRDAAESLVASGALPALPTFFECTTAMAFDLFRDARVETAVLEVGLGGRGDATNVVSPIAAAIVSIALDHEAQLGNTLSSIAREKAGVVRPGIALVCGALPDEAATIIEEICRDQGARMVRADLDVELRRREGDTGDVRVDFVTPRIALENVQLGLSGDHQIANAAVAIRLLDMLDGLGLPTDAQAIRSGLSTVEWPGRLERFTVGACTVLVDAAHNPAGAQALGRYLLQMRPKDVTLVFGAMKDKAIREMLEALAPTAARIICTTAPTPRAMSADAIADLARPIHPNVEIEPDPFLAVARACDASDVTVVAGSIFLIGPVRERLARGILR